MQCLLCHKEMGSDDLYDLFVSNDLICHSCRMKWKRIDLHFELDGIEAFAPYLYEENFSHDLIQMKEVGDEAISDIFLWNDRRTLHRKYHGYTLCLMPSSKEKEERRGFSHLKLLFSCLNLEMMEPFEQIQSMSQKQMSLQQRKRMEMNMRRKEGIVLPSKVLLCDDTITTGSTLRGALRLVQNCEKVKILCISANSAYLKTRKNRAKNRQLRL